MCFEILVITSALCHDHKIKRKGCILFLSTWHSESSGQSGNWLTWARRLTRHLSKVVSLFINGYFCNVVTNRIGFHCIHKLPRQFLFSITDFLPNGISLYLIKFPPENWTKWTRIFFSVFKDITRRSPVIQAVLKGIPIHWALFVSRANVSASLSSLFTSLSPLHPWKCANILPSLCGFSLGLLHLPCYRWKIKKSAKATSVVLTSNRKKSQEVGQQTLSSIFV